MQTEVETSPRKPLPSVLLWAVVATGVILLLCRLFLVYQAAKHVSVAPFDGLFQLFNPLRRVAEGQHVGKDFPFFYMPGTLLVHYPIFALLGKNLFAAEFARQFVGLAAVVFVTAATVTALRLRGPLLALGTAAFLVVVMLTSPGFTAGYGGQILRTGLPFGLLVLALRALVNRPTSASIVWAGVAAGVSTFFSMTDGVGVFLALLVGTQLLGAGSRGKNLALFLASFGVTAWILMAVAEGSLVPAQTLAFYFRDLPGDQFWFFGETPRLADFASRKYRYIFLILVPSLAVAHLAARKVKQSGSDLASWTGPLLIFAWFTLLPNLAKTGLGYITGATFSAAALALLYWRDRPKSPNPQIATAATVVIGVVLTLLTYKWRYTSNTQYNVNQLSGQVLLGTDLDSLLYRDQEAIERVTHGSSSVWAFYSGVYAGVHGLLNPSGSDYIIHTLGEKRRAEYVAAWDKMAPTYVVSERFNYASWLENVHWDIYHRLLSNYNPVDRGPFVYVWERSPQAAAWGAPEPLTVSEEGKRKRLSFMAENPTDVPFLMEVNLKYKVNNPIGKLPLFGGLERILIDNDPAHFDKKEWGEHPAVALNFHAESMSFPIFIPPGFRRQEVSLVVRPYLGVASCQIEGATISQFMGPHNRIDALIASRAADLGNANSD